MVIQTEESKQKKADYHREWVARNRVRMRAYAKARKANESAEEKEKRRAYMQAYNAAHKDEARARNKAWREANHDKVLADHRAWNAANKEKRRADGREYSKRIKGTPKAIANWKKSNRKRPAVILARQENVLGRTRPEVCDICGDKDWRIVFDHCHAKGHARGWLCDGCNKGLGSFRDDPERLIKAAAYLKRYAHVVSPQLAIPGI